MSDSLCTVLTNTAPNSCVTAYTKRLGKPWAISNELLSFLGEWESGVLNGKNFQKQIVTGGFILTAYLDDRGNPTVGMGHLIVPDDKIKTGDTISIERARELARRDLAIAEGAINRRVKVPLFQFEFDSLVSRT
jgi:lysozyme